ncbi:MAG TPA: tetratricopeptide repeat protein, partial [Gemmatimonadales bacterium]|nr:tetratricopeptide repeat protein [Gemmatimonadales bacterium]
LPASEQVTRRRILVRTGLANILQRAGRGAEAVPMREAILAEHRELLGDAEHPDLAADWYNLAIDYISVERLAEAEQPLREAERLLVKAYGESDPRVIPVWLQLGGYLIRRGKLDESAEYARKAEGLLAGDRYAETHPLRGALYQLRARRLLFLGDTGAIAFARNAVDIYRRGKHFALGGALYGLGRTLLAYGRDREAAATFAEAEPVLTKLHGADAGETRFAHVGQAIARWRLSGDPERLKDAVETASAMLGGSPDDASLLAEAAAWIAADLEARDATAAVEWRAHAERALAAVYPAEHPWRTSLAGTRRYRSSVP